MRINFIKQHNLFMRYGKRNKLSSHERMFYIALFYCANNIAMQNENQDWPSEYFPVSNSELNGWTGFDKRAISNLRNSLKQRGLIDFQKGNGKKSDPKYKIFYLKEIGYEIAPDNGANECKNAPDTAKIPHIEYKNAPDTVPDSVPDTVPDSVEIGYKNAPDTDISYLDISNNIKNKNKKINIKANNPIESYPFPDEPASGEDEGMGKDGMDNTIRCLIKRNIGYPDLIAAYKNKKSLIDEIVKIITNIVLYKRDTLTVSGYEYPIEKVREILLSLDETHIHYVLECFDKNTTEIRNIKQYLISTLINSAETMDAYYTALVHRDMPYLAAE